MTPSCSLLIRAGLPAALLALSLVSACGTADSVHDGGGAGAGGAGEPPCTKVVLHTPGAVDSPPDGASFCADGACNYQTQAGCADDEACRPQYPAGSSSVVADCEPTGSTPIGEACDTSSDCERGALCAENVCRKQCCGGDWSACDPGESCIREFLVRFGERTEHPLDLCFPVNDCDLFDPESCSDPDRECKIVDPVGNVACAPKSTRVAGDACSPPNVCAQGFTCVGGTNKICRRLCRATGECAEPGCLEGEGACVHFDRDPPGVGECSPGF